MIEEIYSQYLKDPSKVDASWCRFFEGMEMASTLQLGEVSLEGSRDVRIYHLIESYRTFGHLMAKINPVATRDPVLPRELTLETLGFLKSELDDHFPTYGLLETKKAPLKEIIETLQKIYCHLIGVEYMGYQSPELEKWLQQKIEKCRFRPSFSIEKKHKIFRELNKAELFEVFLHTKYVGQKRFSLEGAETLIPVLIEVIETGASLGMDEFVIGMAHRGRLNVLANVMHKSYQMIFSEFEDYYDPDLTEGTGDVKYHRGFSSDIVTQLGHPVHIGLTSNPSHLESVDAVALGKVRAKQVYRADEEKKRICPILIHGDAALSGQGIVYETMQFYGLPGYSVGGTLHIVVNNQIGFTTLPKDSRSTPYPSDIAKAFSAPVFHVNAEDPEGCIYATELAINLRQRFACDVFIDLNCYRKYGHNESDEPAFTQPLEYKLIRKKKTIRQMYRDQLISESDLEKKMAEECEKEFTVELREELEQLKIKKEQSIPEAFGGVWKAYRRADKNDLFIPVNTSVEAAVLREIAQKFCTLPASFHPNLKIKRLFDQRKQMVEGDENVKTIDWGMGEHLAFGSLLWEGTHVRLSGQDSRRGTFSQRHAMVCDQEDSAKYFPLNHLKESQGRFDVFNSPLSEYAVLGFEFGYSLSYPSALVLWEAQFGDFVNGAQVVIDQYISSTEQKWYRFSGLVMLLPHGFEGQGPEHSSARLERFLQLSGNANWQIVNPTTPAQYFHLLRRQVLRMVRKPLIVFTPKGLLRHPQALSALSKLERGTFQEMIDDSQIIEKGKVNRILFCSGKVYYDLLKERENRGIHHIAIVRVEQLYPFHTDRFTSILSAYSSCKEFYWVQEEPRNMGGWDYIRPILNGLIPKQGEFHYVGRARAASPAIGSHRMHVKEQTQILQMAFE
ncbi:MAG: 2-oxoglutarate dehydrogenase E1 component [Chlamydiia bacterium]|nr:2-oxoglutarate dehydrogenase E1 component [Chlamydiia bacterium]